MSQTPPPENEVALPAAKLTRRDLIRHEQQLRDTLARFISFSASTLYFPYEPPGREDEAVYLPQEKRLLVPLARNGEFLGVLAAKNVRLAAPKTMLRLLPEIVSLILAGIASRKAAQSDALTGLLAEAPFLDSLTESVALAQGCLLPAGSDCLDPDQSPGSGRHSLVVLAIDAFDKLVRAHGHLAGEAVLAETGRIIRRAVPDKPAARLQGERFALLLTDGSPAQALRLAEKLTRLLSGADFKAPGEDHIQVRAGAGCATYPTDLRGAEYLFSAAEVARNLVEKAGKAAQVALGRGDGVLAFHEILARGGLVTKTLPMGRLRTSLGRAVDAQEGQCFLVSEPQANGDASSAFKAEIILTEVAEESSLAEVLNLSDPSWPIEAGDKLHLMDERDGAMAVGPHPSPSAQKDLVTGLYTYRDFLAFFADERVKYDRFSLVLAKIVSPLPGRAAASSLEEILRSLAGQVLEPAGETATGGRFGMGGLVYFVPDAEAGDLAPRMRKLAEITEQGRDVSLAVGLASYPFLNFARADVLEMSRKALDHAMLLPSPRTAVFDSISLNISADRLFTRGDIYGAVEEYKLALLADEGNSLALNSLAVCHARLGRMEKAASLFKSALASDPEDIRAAYNYGHACFKLGETAKAAKAFRRCLALDPHHLFSLIRLGQIAESLGDAAKARKHFTEAAALPLGKALAARHLARLALADGDVDTAREELHRAITHNPRDSQSIALLSGLYLDGGEDPEIAAMLARQALDLRPENPELVELMDRALKALNREASSTGRG